MKITDNHISAAQSAALVNEAIAACYQTIGEIAQLEAKCRAQRLDIEAKLGELIAGKALLESRREI